MSNLKKALVLTLVVGTSLTLSGFDVSAAQTAPNPAQDPASVKKPAPPIKGGAAPVDTGDHAGHDHGPVVQQQPVDPAAFIVKVDPMEVDFGDIPTGDVGIKMIKLINTGDKPMTIVTHRVTCGCTALEIAPNTVLAPKEVKEVKVQLNGGASPGPLHGKKVTFVIEGQPEVEVALKANAVSYVTQEPSSISPEMNPDGKIILKSRDGSPFRVISMQPPLVTEFAKDAAPQHEVVIDWAKYRDMGISRKTVFYFDHPKCQSLMANIVFSPEEIQLAQEEYRKKQLEANQNGEVIPNVPQQPALDPNALMAQMIQQGRNDEVLKKIAEGMDVNARDQQGLSLLSVAAKFGNVDLMKALLNAKADINSTDNAGRTPLMHAGTSKNAESVRLLLDRGASLTSRDTIGGTALTWASGFGDAASVKELLDAGADVEIVGLVTGWTPLIWASGFGDPAVIPLLVNLGANVEVADFLEGATPMIHAARTGKVESIQALLKAGAKLETPDLNGNTPLLSAAKNSGGDAPKVKALIDAGANIHAKDNRGLNALALARKRTDPRGPDVVVLLEPILGAETPTEATAPAAASNAGAAPAQAPAATPSNGAAGANGAREKSGSGH